MKNFLNKVLKYIPWVILIALGVHFGSQALAQAIYDEFTAPLVYDQKLKS